MKTHFYFAKDKTGKFKNDIFFYPEKPEKDVDGNWSGNLESIYISPSYIFYKKLRPILSKIKPGKCIPVSCDLKVIK